MNKIELRKWVEVKEKEAKRELLEDYKTELKIFKEIWVNESIVKEDFKILAKLSDDCNIIMNRLKTLLEKEGYGINCMYEYFKFGNTTEECLIDSLCIFFRVQDHDPKIIELNNKYDSDVKLLANNYYNIYQNLKTMNAKNGREFLKELGFEVPNEKKQERELLAPIDVEFINKFVKGEE